MKYEIENYWNGSNSLMDEADLIEAETGRKALDKFLVTPIYVERN